MAAKPKDEHWVTGAKMVDNSSMRPQCAGKLKMFLLLVLIMSLSVGAVCGNGGRDWFGSDQEEPVHYDYLNSNQGRNRKMPIYIVNFWRKSFFSIMYWYKLCMDSPRDSKVLLHLCRAWYKSYLYGELYQCGIYRPLLSHRKLIFRKMATNFSHKNRNSSASCLIHFLPSTSFFTLYSFFREKKATHVQIKSKENKNTVSRV